jgi:hypothetical protein
VVIGIVANGKYEDMEEPQRPYFYYALSQHYRGGVNVIARTRGDPHQLGEPLAQADPRARPPGPGLRPPSTVGWTLRRWASGSRQDALGLGLLLAVIGLFGAISASARRSSAFASPWASVRGSCFRRFCARRLWSRALESPLDSCWAGRHRASALAIL